MRLASGLFRAATLALIIAGLQLCAGSAATVDEPPAKLTGTWKLIVLAFGEDEFAIINVS